MRRSGSDRGACIEADIVDATVRNIELVGCASVASKDLDIKKSVTVDVAAIKDKANRYRKRLIMFSIFC